MNMFEYKDITFETKQSISVFSYFMESQSNNMGNELKENNCDIFRKIGSLIEIPVFYNTLSAYKNLELHCGYMGR